MSKLVDIEFPPDVQQWLSDVFSTCNAKVTEKLCNNPNMQEEWLDHAWIRNRASTQIQLARREQAADRAAAGDKP